MGLSVKMRCALLQAVLGLVVCAAAAFAEESGSPNLQLHLNDRAMLTIVSRGATVAQIVEQLRQTCAVEIQGLEERRSAVVDFSGAGPVEEVVKDLLKAVGIFDYALEFVGDQLFLVRAMPLSKPEAPVPQDDDEDTAEAANELKAVRVVSLAENGQVRHLDVIPGDIVLTYNGVRVENTRQLIAEVKKTSPNQTVEMLLIRDRLPIRVYLSGGFIGIRIRSEKVDGSGLEKFLP